MKAKKINRTVGVYVTRWLQRTPHRKYLQTLKNTRQWPERLTVAVSGTGPLDEALYRAMETESVRVLDLRGDNPTGHLPTTLDRCFDDALDLNLFACGMLDDDALCLDPSLLFQRVRHGIVKLNAGALGPITQYRLMASHKNEPGTNYWPVSPVHWTTIGCQCYSVDFLRRTKPFWKHLYRHASWRTDFPMFLMADAYGFKALEFWPDHTYRHQSSHCSVSASDIYTEDWYNKYIDRMRIDYPIIFDMVRRFPNASKYIALTLRIAQDNLKNILGKIKGKTDNWTTPIARTFDDLNIPIPDPFRSKP